MKRLNLLLLIICQVSVISAMQTPSEAQSYNVGELPPELLEKIILNIPLEPRKYAEGYEGIQLKRAALKKAVDKIKAFLLSSKATSAFLYDQISMQKIINKVAATLDINPLEVAIYFKTVGANKVVDEMLKKPITQGAELVTEVLIDTNYKNGVTFVAKYLENFKDSDSHYKERLIDHIFDKKATNYYQVIIDSLKNKKRDYQNESHTLRTIRKVTENSLKQFYVQLLDIGLSQQFIFFGGRHDSENEKAWSEIIKQAIQEKQSTDTIAKAILRLYDRGEILEYILKNNIAEYYPMISRLLYDRLVYTKDTKSLKKLIPLIINANLTELFDRIEKDIPAVSGDREWIQKMQDQLAAKRVQLKK